MDKNPKLSTGLCSTNICLSPSWSCSKVGSDHNWTISVVKNDDWDLSVQTFISIQIHVYIIMDIFSGTPSPHRSEGTNLVIA